ncbi:MULTISPECIES: hypothetical protein [Enterococcus]|uniref:Uncharacterized protein n=1 Tax=Enterococcus alcedinis TaxID=1274384 RepID=A0A917JEK7_9ENTE|nr:hypothetical protein [Enterococcus alcedinis]MBP2102207.1 V/A-type H+-transporting ATPase subunit G/H [Enterococcus alcedinis]GGI65768.1 hypothetical protein GCM10011482_14220 [Enterococcus alcedinis]
MSVDAIQKIIEAEVEAEEIIQETAALIQEKKQASQEALDAFRKELREQEKAEQQRLLEQSESEFAQLKAPLTTKTNGEIEKLQQVSPALREKAIAKMIEEVVG